MEDSDLDDIEYFKDFNKTQPNNDEKEIQTEKNESQQNDNSSINYIQHDEANKSLFNIINPEINLAKLILDKCSIEFLDLKNIEQNKNFIMVSNVQCGINNQRITVEELDNFLYASLNSENDDDKIVKNCYIMAKFIEDFIKRIEVGYKNNYPLQVKLELTNTQLDDNVDSIYHVDALYTFYKPYTNNVKSFSCGEENILVYGINSSGFDYMMDFINHKNCINQIDEYNSNKSYKKIARGILNKCATKFRVDCYFGRTFIVIKSVTIGDNKEEIKVKEFENFLDFAMNFENRDEKIFKNIYKAAKLIKDFKERIRELFVNESNSYLTLKLINTHKINNDNIYVIDASLKFCDYLTNEILNYEEKNVLLKDKNSIFSGFFNQIVVNGNI